MDAERGVQREPERWRGTVFLNRLAMITESGGASVNDLFMDPSGPSRPLGITKQMQEGEREREGEEGRCKRVVMWDRGEKQ